ncbi:RmlC-like cupin [Gymnopus androsaceus JB14]|uniref:RmlC-like cupin n=1 Tax=Gymnopus androsaceus JB14 TaxID=1447944 RepID=A0A6A4GD38_9AGAR|nr:RmlC-like cupin [Gymnopus androsaceus JB14]
MLFASSVALAVLGLTMSVQAAPLEGQHPMMHNTATKVTSPPPVPLVTNAAQLATELITEPSNVNKLTALLTKDGNLLTGDALRDLTVLDFNNQEPAAGADGGSILLGTVSNFPILETVGISGAVSFFEPCGLNIPHLHPRADEFLIVMEGQLEAGFVMENGFNSVVHTQLGLHQGTVFPQGSIHYQYNPTCNNATFVAALNSNDPGRSDVVTSFFMLDGAVINAALGFPKTIGGDNIEQWREFLPVNLAKGVDSCLKACGLSI